MDQSNPLLSPIPLFNTADFVRRTYLEYILPLLPKEAVYKSPEIANPYVFNYTGRAIPTERNNYLYDEKNWAMPNASIREKYEDAFTRTMMIAMAILDPSKGQMVVGGAFDWDKPVPISEIAQMILGKKTFP